MEKIENTCNTLCSLIEIHIVYQMENIVGGLADKSEDHTERDHQDGKRSERKYCGVTNLQQS